MSKDFELEEGWSTLLLLIGMIFMAGFGVARSDFFDGLQVLPVLAILSVLTGLLTAKSHFSPRTAHLFAFVIGTFTLIYTVGAVLPGDLPWRARIIEVVQQQVTFIQKLVDGGTNREGFVFVTHAGLGIWLAGYTAAWFTFRIPRVWRAILPAGLILLSVVYYYDGPRPMLLYMAVYILLALLFVARTHLAFQESLWREASVRYDRYITFNFLRAGFVASVLALMLSWSLPTLSASAVVGDALSDTRAPWRKFQDNWTRMYSALRTYGQTTVDPYQDSLVLGGPRTVGDTPVMDVFVARELPYVYWQTIAYDTYSDGLWSTTPGKEALHITDDGPIDLPPSVGRQVITQTVVNYQPNSSLLYGAPEIIGANRDMFVESRPTDEGDALVTTVRSRYVLKQGDQYQITSRYSIADAFSLRSASTDYPQWVTDTYLQVPDTVTPETIALAEEIAAPYDNNFDKAIAVRNYLRETIAYNDQIKAPPPDMDPIHYVLFVNQEGFCNYYASAMAIMLRSQGIPARVASGYAQGQFQQDDNFYRVRQSNAHTWVDVYFPDYGWIQFEPTSAIPIIERPENSDGGGGDAFSAFNNDVEELNPDDFMTEQGFDGGDVGDGLIEDNPPVEGENQTRVQVVLSRFSIWQLIAGVVLIIAVIALSILTSRINYQIESDVLKSYGRLERWGRRMGLIIKPAHTPYERADLLTTAVPESERPVRSLTQQFVQKQFSPTKQEQFAFSSLSEWKQLRPVMLRSMVKYWARQVGRRISALRG